MLALLLDTYLPHDGVDELLDATRFADRTQVEDHLLKRILPVAYPLRPGRREKYNLEQAQKWLGYLAAQMNHEGTRDLAWWRIARWQPKWPRVVIISLIVWLIGGAALSLGSWLVFRAIQRDRLFYSFFVHGMGSGLYVTLFGIVGGFFLAIRWAFLAEPSEYMYRSHPQRFNGFTFKIRAVPESLMGGILGVLAGGDGGIYGLSFGMLIGLLIGAYQEGLASLRLADRLITPASSWRGNQLLTITAWVAFEMGVLLWGGFSGAGFSLSGVSAFPGSNIVMCFICSVAASCALTSQALAGRATSFSQVGLAWTAVLAFTQLRNTIHSPIRFMRFLEDAREREVLRTAGPVYQFRHARLQDLLAETGCSLETGTD